MKVIYNPADGIPAAIEKSWSAAVTCKSHHEDDDVGCGAVMAVRPSDLIVMYFRDCDAPYRNYYAAVKCPLCGKYNAVPKLNKKVSDWLCRHGYEVRAIWDGRDYDDDVT